MSTNKNNNRLSHPLLESLLLLVSALALRYFHFPSRDSRAKSSSNSTPQANVNEWIQKTRPERLTLRTST